MSDVTVKFGKYRGQPIEVLLADRNYCEWLLAQPGFKENFKGVASIIELNMTPEDTPEHNEMQARFLDYKWCVACACAVEGRNVYCVGRDKPSFSTFSRIIEFGVENNWIRIEGGLRPDDCVDVYFSEPFAVFEENNIDVTFSVSCGYWFKSVEQFKYITPYVPTFDTIIEKFYKANPGVNAIYDFAGTYRVELKPMMGDDYPSVLRKCRGVNVLVCRSFASGSVSFGQMKEIFRRNGVKVVMEHEISEWESKLACLWGEQ